MHSILSISVKILLQSYSQIKKSSLLFIFSKLYQTTPDIYNKNQYIINIKAEIPNKS